MRLPQGIVQGQAWRVVTSATIFLAICMVGAVGAQQIPLMITTPNDGAFVSPGDTVTVEGIPSPGTRFDRGIVVLSEDPLGDAGPLLTPPYVFSIAIPPRTSPRGYLISAVGVDSLGGLKSSPSIRLNVEIPRAILHLRVEPSRVRLPFTGASIPLRVVGIFEDGSSSNGARSAQASFVSG